MFAALRTLLAKWFQPPQSLAEAEPASPPPQIPEFLLAHHEETSHSHPVPYDENLLERARGYWQAGEWEQLIRLDRDVLEHHPDRAKLALLAAAGHLQTGAPITAKPYLTLAKQWGCDKRLIARILTAGVHNSLGKAAAIAGLEQRALSHFESSIAVGTPGSAQRRLGPVRIAKQYQQLGLPTPECPPQSPTQLPRSLTS